MIIIIVFIPEDFLFNLTKNTCLKERDVTVMTTFSMKKKFILEYSGDLISAAESTLRDCCYYKLFNTIFTLVTKINPTGNITFVIYLYYINI